MQAQPPKTEEMELLRNWFTYHSPTPEQQEAYVVIRETALSFAAILLEKCPPSADRTAAIRKLRECVATANMSIACSGK